jgi:hypothetical protein
MDRQEFFGRMGPLDDAGLRKALWNLYWRGTATMRERIEAELNPHSQVRRQPPARPAVDPDRVLDEARDFVALARSGAYMGGDRRVSGQERSRWRFTFQRLAAEAQQALLSPDGTVAGGAALAELIDLANDTRDYDYFHSEDPMEAARFVVSDAVTVLWRGLLQEHGFAGFAERAAPQLIRWESRFGWTRTGFGALSEKECSLASVLAGMLRSPDMWIGVADSYLAALDLAARDDTARPKQSWPGPDRIRDRRTEALSEWHGLLLAKLKDYGAEDRLDRLSKHGGLGGAELTFLQAKLANARGDVAGARSLVHQALTSKPGHKGFLEFAGEIGAPLPPNAQRIVTERSLPIPVVVPA